jgi:hypothetical protein
MKDKKPEKELQRPSEEAERSEIIEEQSNIIAQVLLGEKKSIYGEHYKAHLLEQYKKYLEMADKISDRRAAANTFFLTVNTGLISAFGLAKVVTQNNFDFLFIAGSVAAILLCYSWYRLIRSYQDLNTAKFKVVHEIENNLPLRPFDAEWEAVGRGKNKNLYFPFTHIERRVPWIFMLLYLGVIFYSLYRRNFEIFSWLTNLYNRM